VTGSRDTTTVAAQALYLLNDPFVLERSQALAQRVLASGTDDAARIDLACRLALSRHATPNELARATSYLSEYQTASQGEGASDPRLAAWTSFCQALLASAEFRYNK
jgi:hypothetical protein